MLKEITIFKEGEQHLFFFSLVVFQGKTSG